jgi:cob(I)alamin adenosyltransferase
MKIYTKGGDTGQTSLYGGQRVFKDDLRIECYGTVDELNSFIGLLASGIQGASEASFLLWVQKKLFDIGSILAAGPGKELNLPQVSEEDVIKIENQIDNITSQLEPLTDIHSSRWICRNFLQSCVQNHLPTSRKKMHQHES